MARDAAQSSSTPAGSPSLSPPCAEKPGKTRWLLGVALFLLSYAYVWWVVDPAQFWHNRQRAFFLGTDFLLRYARHIGGLVEYAGAFLVQFYQVPWLGALIVTGLLLAAFGLTRALLHRREPATPGIVPLLLTAFLFLMYRLYITIVPLLALVLVLLAAWLWTRSAARSFLLRLALCFALALLVAYLAAGAAVLFALLCVALSLPPARQSRLAAACLLAGLLSPWLLRLWLYEPDLLDLYLRRIPLDKPIENLHAGVLTLYLLYPAAVFAAPVLPRLRRWAGDRGWPPRWAGRRLLRVAYLAAGILLLIPYTVVLRSRFQTGDRLMRADFLMEQGRWEEALAALRGVPISSELCSHIANRCLYHTGRLGQEMFAFPQYRGTESLLLNGQEVDTVLRAYRKRSEVYYELGMVNEAERWAHETLTNQGELPAVLRQLVRINILKGRPATARLFLQLLRRTPLQRAWADEFESSLRRDPAGLLDTELNRIRPLLSRTDYVGPWSTEELLLHALDQNPRNRMAYEYLMASYLLNGDLDRFVGQLQRHTDFFPVLPRHYEEALLASLHFTGKAPAGFESYRPRPETLARFQEFLRRFAAYRHDPQTAWYMLAPDFGDTYWFFDVFTRTAAGPPFSPDEAAAILRSRQKKEATP